MSTENEGAAVETQQEVPEQDAQVDPTQPNTQPQQPSNTDPLPAEARALLNDPRHRVHIDAILNHTRSQATKPLRNEIEEQRNRIRELEAAQRGRVPEVAPDSPQQTEATSTEPELAAQVRGLEERLATLQGFVQTSALETFRMELLRTIPSDVLPPEFHPMVNGGSREELSESLRSAIDSYSALRSRLIPQVQAPPQQQFVQPQTVPNQMPAALQAPENGATISPTEINSGTVLELAQRAMRTRNPEDLRAWEEASQGLVMSELKKQGKG